MNIKKIKRAIISVSDKSNLKLILPTLKKFNIKIISSGGSFKKIRNMNYNCVEVSDYTGFSEILDGRVKTLNPKPAGGLEDENIGEMVDEYGTRWSPMVRTYENDW